MFDFFGGWKISESQKFNDRDGEHDDDDDPDDDVDGYHDDDEDDLDCSSW